MGRSHRARGQEVEQTHGAGEGLPGGQPGPHARLHGDTRAVTHLWGCTP